jgi:hypothetical protein
VSGRSFIRIIFGLLILLLLTHCAAKPAAVVKKDEREILRNRVGEYWDLMINVNAKNAEKLYQYEAPSFREKVSFLEYVNRFKMIRYLSADVTNIEIEGNKGKVTVTSDPRVTLPTINKAKLPRTDVENWIKVEGTWYHFPREWVMPVE